jgi:hypothetical protein
MEPTRAKLSSVARPVVQYFSTLSLKRRDFRGGAKFNDHKMCVLVFSTNFVCNISHSKKNSARFYAYHSVLGVMTSFLKLIQQDIDINLE